VDGQSARQTITRANEKKELRPDLVVVSSLPPSRREGGWLDQIGAQRRRYSKAEHHRTKEIK
jgi:hypothetical protein